jgi:hypothetical protein
MSTLDELIAWATDEAHKDDLLAAKSVYSERTGEVFDDDRQLEARLASFLEWYVCDRVAPWLGVTPARARYEQSLTNEMPTRAQAFRAYTETLHGLFDVTHLDRGSATLQELVTQIHYRVRDERSHLGFNKGDVIEARLVPAADDFVFTPAQCWHPTAAAPLLRAEVKRRQTLGARFDIGTFTAEAARRALKADRYRQIALERIYDFVDPKL